MTFPSSQRFVDAAVGVFCGLCAGEFCFHAFHPRAKGSLASCLGLAFGVGSRGL